ncbi:MAG: ABC transporter substrate-binding protein [Planctomycetes bacterium]|nr:ABC transporter substrate-binding protein [Planctomycetota bacterium]
MSPLRLLAWILPLVLLALVSLSYLRKERRPAAPAEPQVAAGIEDEASGYPRDVRMPEGGTAHLTERPKRVVVANASLMDTVTAIWPPSRLAAIPVQALTWSTIARRPEPFGALPRFERFDAEEIFALKPDLVICTTLSSAETVSALQQAGVTVFRLPLPEELDGARRDLALIATVLGVEARAQEFDERLQERIEALIRDVGDRTGLRAAFYVHDGSEGWSSGARTPAEEILRIAGLDNATSSAGHIGSVRLSFEELVAMDPELIVVPSAFGEEDGQTAALLRSESALASMQAVKRNRIVPLHPSLFATSSIEIVTAAEELAKAVDELLVSSRRNGR